jgi:site-specific DNA-methyltransferase (adenine-specific)
MKLLLGDCLEKLKELDDNSVDSIVTDPPYGLAFMGKHWDYDVPSQQIWEECMRVLKPGGHILSFAGSRTYHRMAVRIEDAGFEIRDQIMWIYGSGFPKSHNIGKAVDKLEGNEREVVGTKIHSQKGVKVAEERTTIGAGAFGEPREANVTKGNSEWEGWGTALKPAHEPIVMARKPLSEKTVADNVLEWGTGGINIDGCRIETVSENDPNHRKPTNIQHGSYDNTKNVYGNSFNGRPIENLNPQGRFPANLILDEEAGKLLDEQSGISKSIGGRIEKKIGWGEFGGNGSKEIIDGQPGFGDVGGASRFFYCPKTSKTDRNEGLDDFEKKVTMRDDGQPYGMNTNKFRPDGSERNPVEPKANHHPTVKPTDLMLYLIRLVTPKGGVTLDPFMGSGSTGKAAVRGGFDFIGIEREEEYMEIAKSRIEYEKKNPIIVETPAGKKVEVKKEVEEKVNQFFG